MEPSKSKYERTTFYSKILLFGDDFVFDDATELNYYLPIRNFTSFNQAASEAAISRMYGGIHYRAAVDVGVKQGRDLRKFIIDNLKMLNN